MSLQVRRIAKLQVKKLTFIVVMQLQRKYKLLTSEICQFSIEFIFSKRYIYISIFIHPFCFDNFFSCQTLENSDYKTDKELKKKNSLCSFLKQVQKKLLYAAYFTERSCDLAQVCLGTALTEDGSHLTWQAGYVKLMFLLLLKIRNLF